MTTTENQNPKCPLAHDADGNPLDVPRQAVGWRVRRLAAKAGRPKVVFDLERGRPLELPLTVDFAELAEHLTESGRYRLEAIDTNGRAIPGCVAVTELQIEEEDDERPASMSGADVVPYLVSLVEKVVDSNARVMEAMASAFGQVRPQRQEPMIAVEPRAASGGHGNGPGAMPSITNLLDVMNQVGASISGVVNNMAAQKAAAEAAAADAAKSS